MDLGLPQMAFRLMCFGLQFSLRGSKDLLLISNVGPRGSKLGGGASDALPQKLFRCSAAIDPTRWQRPSSSLRTGFRATKLT